MRSLNGLVIFTVFGWFLCLYGCSVFPKSQTTPLTKQTDSISQIVSSIIELSEDSSVLILGEKHGNPESQKLTLALVNSLIYQGNKVFLGLEIPSSSQDDLERVLVGEEPVCEEFISPAELAPAYPRPASKRSQQDASLAPEDECNKKEMDHKYSICQHFHAFHR
jgi:hypothetical protein